MEFEAMMKQIESYHGALGQRRAYDTPLQKMQSVRNLSLALMMELAELVDSLPWKPWREIEDQPFDIDNVKREMIDIIFFLGAIREDLGITPEELVVTYKDVMINNTKRLTDGYSKLDFARADTFPKDFKRCPKCGSVRIVREDDPRTLEYSSLCTQCGYRPEKGGGASG